MAGCLITLHRRGKKPYDMELGSFLYQNDFSIEELRKMFFALSDEAGDTYFGGGGASPKWAVALSNGSPRNLLK